MFILFLTHNNHKTTLIDFLTRRGCRVKRATDRINNFSDYDLVLSFGYRHIITPKQLGKGTYHAAQHPPKEFLGWDSIIEDEIKRLKGLVPC